MAKLLYLFPGADALGFLRGQAQYMRRHGFETYSVTSEGPLRESLANELELTSLVVPMARDISPLRDVRSIVSLVALIRRLQPDIVHANTVKGGLLGMIAARLAGSRVRIYHQHGLSAIGQSRLQDALIATAERVSALLSTRTISVSESVRHTAIERGWWSESKSKVLLSGSGNGVDTAGRFSPARWSQTERLQARLALNIPVEAPVVGYVGRLATQKGLQELWDAWLIVREMSRDCHLLIVGEIDAIDPIPASLLSEMNSDPRVSLAGYLADTSRAFAIMDVFAFPSYREGFGNVLLEAASMEVPVVATLTWGCVDAVQDGVSGTLVETRNGAALASAILDYLEHPDLGRAHGKAGRQRAIGEFDSKRVWNAMREEYLALLKSQGKAAVSDYSAAESTQ